MQAELIAIGDEVLSGSTINSNVASIAKTLSEEGIDIIRHSVVGDVLSDIIQVVNEALVRGSIVITTGGLGPTGDDLTREAVATLFQREQIIDQELAVKLITRFGNIATCENQATIIQGATLFDNHLGSASGFALEDKAVFGRGILICLPGVPLEMKELMKNEVVPFLRKKERGAQEMLYTKAIHFIHLKESDIDPLLQSVCKEYNLQYGIYPALGKVTVHIKKRAKNREEFEEAIAKAVQLLKAPYQHLVYEAESGLIEQAVHNLLIKKNLTLATAESCTGGAIAASFVRMSDASLYFRGSIVAYSNEIKEKILHLDSQILDTFGAVSQEVTKEMAESVLKMMDVDLAIAISGILGPTGGTKEKPVGTVCASIAFKEAKTRSWTMHFSGNRDTVRQRVVTEIIGELYLLVNSLF